MYSDAIFLPTDAKFRAVGSLVGSFAWKGVYSFEECVGGGSITYTNVNTKYTAPIGSILGFVSSDSNLKITNCSYADSLKEYVVVGEGKDSSTAIKVDAVVIPMSEKNDYFIADIAVVTPDDGNGDDSGNEETNSGDVTDTTDVTDKTEDTENNDATERNDSNGIVGEDKKGGRSAEIGGKVVFTSLLVEGSDTPLTPTNGKYFIAYGISNVAASVTGTITVTPYATLLDGTTIYGASANYSISAGTLQK